MKAQETKKKTANPAQLQSAGKSAVPPAFSVAASSQEAPLQGKFPDGQPQGNGPIQRQEMMTLDQNMSLATSNPAPQEWQDFAVKFNDEFKSVLHVFEPKPVSSEPMDAAKFTKIGDASGAALTAEQLKELFTDKQRAQLMDFMDTKVIPDRLFNGDERGKTTAQQRLLLAGHILVAGKYKPGSFDQKVHARMCWHWVHITHHYAGASTSGALNQGMMGMFDHNNNVVLGAGKNTSIFHGKGVTLQDLPKEYDSTKNLGPMAEGSDHLKNAEAEQAKNADNPEAKNTYKMLHNMPFQDLEQIQPGDWIWYYNGNGSGIGSHSVIFSRWASGVETRGGVRFRKAICFSQGMPEWGGREHYANLGERYYQDGDFKISPVNYCTRVSEDAHAADTVDELLPKGSEKREKVVQTENEKFLTALEKKTKRQVDRSAVKEVLRKENKGHIASLGDRLTKGQKDLLDLANQSNDIETLVRLTQRLRAIVNNDAIMTKNQDATNESKGEQYAQTVIKVDAEKAKVDAELARLAEQKSDLEAKKLALSNERDDLDTAPEAKTKKKELDAANKFCKDFEKKHSKKNPELLKTDEEYLKQKALRDKLSGEHSELIATGKANGKRIGEINKEIAALKKKLSGIPWQVKVQEDKWSKANKQLPFSLVHPGSWKGEQKGGTTGLLKDAVKSSDLEPALGDPIVETKPEIKKPKAKSK